MAVELEPEHRARWSVGVWTAANLFREPGGRRSGLGWLALLPCLAVAAHGAGVTLVTHGFNSDVASWIIPMQDRITRYGGLSPAATACYEVTVTQNGLGQHVAAATFLAGTNPLAAPSGEVLIKLNWSSLSALGGSATPSIAAAATAALLSTNLIPALAGRPLAELPLHLAGHSRGASVVAEMARMLGAEGVWVDHLTALDPVPVSSLGDPPVKLHDNILFADNYWQNLGVFLDPQGQSLPGAYNRRLSNLGGAAYSAHSDVHLWYHGTVDFRTPVTVDGATLGGTERQNWWLSAEQRGTNAGFRWSRLGGGNRLSALEPAGPGLGRISDGFNRHYDLGAGLASNRTARPVNNGSWPNPILLSHSLTHAVPAGSPFMVTLWHQSGTSTATNLNLQLLLDRDLNPWNDNAITILQQGMAGTGTNAVAGWNGPVQPDATTVTPGSYHLAARLSLGLRARYLYAPGTVTLTPATNAPALIAMAVTNGTFTLRVLGLPGQNIVTETSETLTNWFPLTTNAGPSFTVLDTNAASARFYRAVLRP